ncbi:Calcium/calmodulin-dependent serine/threonine-protein kinase 1 [Taenia solium]|eukprot:TsM_001162900 transcript=TsM_001162900 gene=TsM_001162900
MSWEPGPPKLAKLTESAYFMAPEVRVGMKVTKKADMWCLGVLVATTMCGRMTTSGLLRRGEIRKGDLRNASTPLRRFFRACLRPDHRRRVGICNVKRLRFYKDAN